MLSRLKAWYERMEEKVKRAMHSKHAFRTLFIVAYLENFFSPIPADILVAPLAVHHPEKKWRIVLSATLASVLGSLTGYAIGYFLFQSVGMPIVTWYGGENAFASFKTVFDTYGFAALLVVAFTPLPDKVFTLLSGLVATPLIPFILAMALGRMFRFGIVAYLAATYGRSAYSFLRNKFGTVTFIFSAIIITIILFYHFAVQ